MSWFIANDFKYISIELPDAFYWGSKDPWSGLRRNEWLSHITYISLNVLNTFKIEYKKKKKKNIRGLPVAFDC